jgi:hypothetical protein
VLIFALHPFFTLQPLAVTFTHVWVSYFFLGLSFYWMILAVQKPGRYWLYTLLSILAGAVNILSGEYFAGLEFLRPVLIWFALTGRNLRSKERLLLALRYWLPYLLVFGVYIYWRFFIFEVPLEKRNSPLLIEALLSNPLTGLGLILTNLIPDTVLIVLSSWYKLLEPGWLDLTVRVNQMALLLALGAGGLTFYYLNQQKFNVTQTGQRVNWPLQAFFLGISIVVLGLIPPYVGGLFLNAKNPLWNSRFGMASLLGASLMVVALLELLISSSKARTVLMAALVGLSAGWHLRYTNDFRRAWEKEVNFYEQLAVRVPALAPHTALVAEGEILSRMGDYPTAYAINTLYARQGSAEQGQMPVWFYGITTNFGRDYEEFVRGMKLYTRHRSMVFKGDSHEIVLFSFEPSNGQCLHIIRPQDAQARILPDRLRTLSSLSALDRIRAGDSFSAFLGEELGLEPAANWCNTYQRADLARQFGDWDEVIRLWRQAQTAGLAPNDNFEYLPFLEAYLYTNQPESALKLSVLAAEFPPSMRPTVCDVWQRTLGESAADAEMQAAYQQIQESLDCSGN